MEAFTALHELVHGLLDVLLEDRLARQEPLAVVVAGQSAKERHGFRGEAGKCGAHMCLTFIIEMMPTTEEVLARLAGIPNLTVSSDAPLSRYTRFGIGGPADLYAETAQRRGLRRGAGGGARERHPGHGDRRRHQPDRLRPAASAASCCATAASACSAAEQPRRARMPARYCRTWWISRSSAGLKGLETLAGIPGSVGAAIYGNAGAYGHSISERVREVRFYDGREVRVFDNAECEFHYRESIFKRRKDWIIFSTELQLEPADAARAAEDGGRDSQGPQREVPGDHEMRRQHLQEPAVEGSAAPDVAAEVPASAVREGKVPAAWFLEQVGAKGMRARRHPRGRLPRQPDLQRRRGHGRRSVRA